MPQSLDLYPGTAKWFIRFIGLLSAVALAVTVCIGYSAWNSRTVETVYLLAILWAVVPPIWFWFEYFFVYKSCGDPNAFEAFKHGQQLTVAIWAAVTLALTGLASSDHFKDEPGKGSVNTSRLQLMIIGETPANPGHQADG